MANVKSLNVSSTIDSISDYAPLVIFMMMLAMFGLTGWMQHHFLKAALSEKIEGVSYLIFLFPIIVQVLRFVTGFLSASFFKKGKWLIGFLVLGFSIWLSVFEYSKVDDMTTVWTTIDLSTEAVTHYPTHVDITKNIIRGIMIVLIWGALVLEFFLAFWISSVAEEDSAEGLTEKSFSTKSPKGKTDGRPRAGSAGK